VDDKEILHRITELVDEEHELRTRRLAGQVTSDEEVSRLGDLEESLDQCWDLLRRRRAARNAGIDPDEVEERPRTQVEGYTQ
jgi:hypothetical protein